MSERPIHARLQTTGAPLTLVAVAAILVAGIRLPFLGEELRGGGTRSIPADAGFAQGRAYGLVRAWLDDHRLRAAGFGLCAGIEPGGQIRAGEPLLGISSDRSS